MSRRAWLAALCVYALAGIADGSYKATELRDAAGAPSAPGALAIAFCAGLFWPLDIAARVLLAR